MISNCLSFIQIWTQSSFVTYEIDWGVESEVHVDTSVLAVKEMLVVTKYSVVGSYATILIVDVENSDSNPIDWNMNFPKNI